MSNPFPLLVCGSRGLSSSKVERILWKRLDKIHAVHGNDMEIISGMAPGVDLLAFQWAMEREVPCLAVPARWKREGKKAGFLRNKVMLNRARSVLAIYDGKSPGTSHTIREAKMVNKPLTVVKIVKRKKNALRKRNANDAYADSRLRARRRSRQVANSGRSAKGSRRKAK